MSSESSGDESYDEGDITRCALIVKKIPWLKKKYRDAFHQIDKAYYSTHKKSQDKLKPRIPGGNSKRKLHDDTPTFAMKSTKVQTLGARTNAGHCGASVSVR